MQHRLGERGFPGYRRRSYLHRHQWSGPRGGLGGSGGSGLVVGGAAGPLHIAWLELLSAVLRAMPCSPGGCSSRASASWCAATRPRRSQPSYQPGVHRACPTAARSAGGSRSSPCGTAFELRAEHISGSDNVRANSLSRRLAEADDQQLRLKPGVFGGLCGSGPFRLAVDCYCDNAG
ncbi:hypothetical protein PLESTB_001356000 [Pleodorina starrii]|uniref:Uncharacterized protein n=1 Tax=Pleodorina starrii TaxID=330485 RepID=A0A9W6BUE5_9CHLO|nr:hypothetical protein PLESTB_001356000 [Pleodorina starrii]